MTKTSIIRGAELFNRQAHYKQQHLNKARQQRVASTTKQSVTHDYVQPAYQEIENKLPSWYTAPRYQKGLKV